MLNWFRSWGNNFQEFFQCTSGLFHLLLGFSFNFSSDAGLTNCPVSLMTAIQLPVSSPSSIPFSNFSDTTTIRPSVRPTTTPRQFAIFHSSCVSCQEEDALWKLKIIIISRVRFHSDCVGCWRAVVVEIKKEEEIFNLLFCAFFLPLGEPVLLAAPRVL